MEKTRRQFAHSPQALKYTPCGKAFTLAHNRSPVCRRKRYCNNSSRCFVDDKPNAQPPACIETLNTIERVVRNREVEVTVERASDCMCFLNAMKPSLRGERRHGGLNEVPIHLLGR